MSKKCTPLWREAHFAYIAHIREYPPFGPGRGCYKWSLWILSLPFYRSVEAESRPFSSPVTALLLVSTKNHDLWPGPVRLRVWMACKHNRFRPEPIGFVRLGSEHAQIDGKSVNRGLPVLDLARGSGADQKERSSWGREWVKTRGTVVQNRVHSPTGLSLAALRNPWNKHRFQISPTIVCNLP